MRQLNFSTKLRPHYEYQWPDIVLVQSHISSQIRLIYLNMLVIIKYIAISFNKLLAYLNYDKNFFVVEN